MGGGGGGVCVGGGGGRRRRRYHNLLITHVLLGTYKHRESCENNISIWMALTRMR